MDNLFWADEAVKLYQQGHTAKEAIRIVELKKELQERSKSNGNDNTISSK